VRCEEWIENLNSKLKILFIPHPSSRSVLPPKGEQIIEDNPSSLTVTAFVSTVAMSLRMAVGTDFAAIKFAVFFNCAAFCRHDT
jgi:hypothetical protein